MVDTWGGRSEFEYQGNLQQGTVIIYGANNHITVTAEQYQQLIIHFAGQNVTISPSRTDPETGSLENWLHQHVTRTAIASYVAPILVLEGVAVRTPENTLIFNA